MWFYNQFDCNRNCHICRFRSPIRMGFGAGLLAAFGKEIIDNVRSWMKLEGTFKEKFKVLLNTTLRDSGFDIVATGLGAWIAIFLVQIIQLS